MARYSKGNRAGYKRGKAARDAGRKEVPSDVKRGWTADYREGYDAGFGATSKRKKSRRRRR